MAITEVPDYFQKIYNEFLGAMENIRNSFYISFLSIFVLDHRPLNDGVFLRSFEQPGIIGSDQLNSLGIDSIEEYANSIRRHTLNDIMINYEQYASKMIVSMKESCYSGPELFERREYYVNDFEKMNNVLAVDEVEFIRQFRRLRNSIVHYNGVYNKANQLDYVFLKNKYKSVSHEGENITIDFESIMYIYHKILSIVASAHVKFLSSILS